MLRYVYLWLNGFKISVNSLTATGSITLLLVTIRVHQTWNYATIIYRTLVKIARPALETASKRGGGDTGADRRLSVGGATSYS
jgi:hypothetical protein